ncbi:MAG: hypothetical protein EBR06_04645, partial [Acidimicrobiia bacterium]|nr:hypothetical protein [Acidimicrobiia bacterium]
YLGWLLTASITSATAVLVCKPRHAHEARTLIAGAGSKSTTSPLPRITYATLAVLSTIGFAVFFDDLVVAVVGGVSMGVFVWLSFAKRIRPAA